VDLAFRRSPLKRLPGQVSAPLTTSAPMVLWQYLSVITTTEEPVNGHFHD